VGTGFRQKRCDNKSLEQRARFRLRARYSSVALGAVASVLLAAGIPALGQDKPESILPPGFGDPVATPTPAPARTAAPNPAATAVAAPIAEGGTPTPVASETPVALPTPDAAALARYEMPEYARRSISLIGVAGPGEGALGVDAFGRAQGHYLEMLMRRLDAPIASRWLSIALRRALMAKVATPHGVNGADFAAERAWLLLRMGESVAARAVVQSVDSEDYTPKLYQIAMQAALATGDPAALCPLADAAVTALPERGWVLAQAMCAGLAGQPAKAQPLITAARKTGLARGVDLLLAQKVAGAGSQGQQAVTIEWDGVDQLTAWRYGLATATGVEIPDTLLATVQPNVQSWRAQSPALDPRLRAAAADQAAVRGVFSNAALVDLYGAIDANDDQSTAENGTARDLRTAYTGADWPTRLDALKQLWDEPTTPDGRFARLILTARAAARVPVQVEQPDIDRLVASMLTAGLDRTALRWRTKAPKGGDAWAMLALADPDRVTFSYSDVKGYSGANDPEGLKRRMLFAGLAGLNRLSAADVERGASALDVRIGAENSWTRAIGRAALSHQPGTVVLLASIGMQTRLWHGVSPEALYHVVAALRAVGMESAARMIAAEAIARL
jgi:hypothetical protein